VAGCTSLIQVLEWSFSSQAISRGSTDLFHYFRETLENLPEYLMGNHGRKIPVLQNMHVQVGDSAKNTIPHSISIRYSPALQNCRTPLIEDKMIKVMKLLSGLMQKEAA